MDNKINSIYFKKYDEIQPLNEAMAIEKGIEFFYESLFYSLIIIIPLVEIIKSELQKQ